MANRYIPHTQHDVDKMLDACGIQSTEELFQAIPRQLRVGAYDVPTKGFNEPEIRRYFSDLSAKNRKLACFAGAGYYNHYTPAITEYIKSRSEFLTAYTPYQPEISQGTLQYIFEYQSMICSLTGMDVTNASMYDGATATVEAMFMSAAQSRKSKRILASATLGGVLLPVLTTYARWHGLDLRIIPEADGVTNRDALRGELAEGPVAGVILPEINFYGIIEELEGVADEVHAAKGLFVINCHASPLGVLKSPGEWGADIACGEAQSLGIPLSYGGPYLGYLACRKNLMRKLPGRIVGATTDASGQRCFVLTLQAREQHIRREKATSNICSNQSLMALHAAVYLSIMGPQGLKEVCDSSFRNAHALCSALEATGKMKLVYPHKPFFNEFLMHSATPVPVLMDKCIEAGILPGVMIDEHRLLIAATEMCTAGEMNLFVSLVANTDYNL